ncbi:G-protein coupled receptor dmsr-1-like [Hetaerina americana]|uniref:G-protein coupled receptor dmsr-1-like n=1 Tax=Hetaerina americana TaxID=62018 RepID=UPI003A7F2903
MLEESALEPLDSRRGQWPLFKDKAPDDGLRSESSTCPPGYDVGYTFILQTPQKRVPGGARTQPAMKTCKFIMKLVRQKLTERSLSLSRPNSSRSDCSDASQAVSSAQVSNLSFPVTNSYNERHVLRLFQKWYRPIHGPLALVICTLGCVANAVNVAVLSRPPMRSPTNAILTALAVADLLVMAEYIPFAAYTILSTGQPQHRIYTFPWAAFTLFHANFGQVFHTVSIWLTVMLAVWRYVAVGHPLRNREWCGRARAHRAIAFAYIASPIICAPLYFAMSIRTGQRPAAPPAPNGTNVTLYFVGPSELSQARDDLLQKLNFWLYAVIIKLLPCALLTLLSLALVSALAGTERRRRQVIKRGPNSTGGGGGGVGRRQGGGMGRRADRTTAMLLAVLLLFLVSEVPQGVLGLLSVIIGKRFFQDCYHSLGEAMDLLALTNGAVNFVVYCTMSRQFRDTFSSLFCRYISHKDSASDDGNGNISPITRPPMEAPLCGQSTWVSRRDSGAAETQVTAV